MKTGGGVLIIFHFSVSADFKHTQLTLIAVCMVGIYTQLSCGIIIIIKHMIKSH